MKEYEIYFPLRYNDGRAIPQEQLDSFKKILLAEFGGLTHFPQQNEGTWKVGNVTFRDEVVILRVLSDAPLRARQFLTQARAELMRSLEQADLLIVERAVTLIH